MTKPHIVQVVDSLNKDITDRLIIQMSRFPAGFPADRNGIRLGLAAVQDELKETLDAWHEDKRQQNPDWHRTYDELLDIIAAATYTAIELHRKVMM